MYSPSWIVIITAIHLPHCTSFSARCNRPLNNYNSHGEKDTTTTSSEEWHYIPRDILLNNRDNKDIARGCDAIVNKLNMNDNTLDQYVWTKTFQSQFVNIRYDVQNDDTSIHQSHNDTSTVPPLEAIEAIEATHRWAENFVRQLSLCPWAGSSLDAVGAIRYWVLLVDDDINDDDDIQNNKIILDGMEDIVRDAGKHLKQITSSTDDNLLDTIDPSVAISFVLLVSLKSSNSLSQQPNHLEFGDFHDFFLNLEDKLLDECDEYWEQIDNTDEDTLCDNEVPIGCDITVAGFHPQWQFGSEDGSSSDQSIDYEKRTPYPTISIVMSEAIDALMNEDTSRDSDSGLSAPATERIADRNERTLTSIGVEKLRKMFRSNVLQCPMRSKHED